MNKDLTKWQTAIFLAVAIALMLFGDAIAEYIYFNF